MVNVYIRLEVAKRELEAKILLALAAAESGFDVFLGDVTQEHLVRWKAPRGIFHDNNATPHDGNLRTRKQLLESGFRLTVQDEEHGIPYSDYSEFARERFSSGSLAQVSALFCWGRNDSHYLANTFPEHKGRIVVCGSPRVDVWGSTFFRLFEREVSEIPDPAQSFVLVVSSFEYLGSGQNVSEQLRHFRTMTNDENQADLSRGFLGHVEREAWAAGHIFDIIRTLRTRYPELCVLVRPHPTESGDLWKTLFAEDPLVLVGSSDVVAVPLRRCLAMVHASSTTAVEARLGEIPVVTLSSKSTSGFVALESLGNVSRSSKEAIECLRDYVEGGKQQRVPLSVEEKSFLDSRILRSRDESELAVDRMVKTWVAIANDAELGDMRVTGAQRLRVSAKWQYKVRDKVGARLVTWSSTRDRFLHHSKLRWAFPPLNEREIDGYVRDICRVTGRFANVRATSVTPRLIHFRLR